MFGTAATGVAVVAGASFLRDEPKRPELPAGIEVLDKRGSDAWRRLTDGFKATQGKVWDILGWNGVIPEKKERFYSNLFILSDVDEAAKQTVDIYDCFGIALVGTSRDTRRRLSAVAHQNVGILRDFGEGEVFKERFLIPTLRREGRPLTEEEMAKPEWENPREVYERTLRAWVREFMDKTLDEDRRIIMGDSQYHEDGQDKPYYMDSAHYLFENLETASGVKPQVLSPKVPREDMLDQNYRAQTTDLLIFTQEDRVVFARPSYPKNRDEVTEGLPL